MHIEMMMFLDKIKDWDNSTGVLQVFRGGAKSTMIALWIVYMLTKDPTLRFLVLSADHLTAKRITEDCISIIRRHPLAHDLKGREQTWQKHRFSVRGSVDARNPSVAAHGIMSNITSARADIAVFDDVEVPKNCHSDELREQLRRRISEVTHILIPQTGRRLFVGTPHTYESIYPEIIQKGCSSLTLPLLSDTSGEFPNIVGKSRWIERFTPEVVKERQLSCKSKSEFYSQYMLLPMSVEDSVLDPSLIKVYKESVQFGTGNGEWYATIGKQRMASVSAWWDVSLSKARGDDSVFAIIFTDTEGHIWVHKTVELTGDVHEQCEQVKDAAVEYNIPLVAIETNGVGAFVPQILLGVVRGKGIGVDEQYTTANKKIKIIEAFETPLSGGFLHVHEDVYNSKFVTQMRDFNTRTSNQKDDYIDAVASAITQEPIRIGRTGPLSEESIKRWRTVGSVVEAEMEYATN